MAEASAALDELALLVVRNLPQALLVVLVTLVVALVAKDVVNGMLRRPFLDPSKWQPLTLVDVKQLSHNTRRFRFALPHQEQVLGLPLGQHVSLKGTAEDGSEVMRPYTPTSETTHRGQGRFRYERGSKKAIGMLAGGSGITPMFQVMQHILKDPNDNTALSLVYANVTGQRGFLSLLLSAGGRVYYVLNNPPKGWQGGKGFVTADMIKKHLPAPGTDVLILRCGPGPMNKAMEAHMDALGYTNGQQFQF
ncbi:hypothetical protein CHLNCDRAFT_141423 [Chlorella variabilis]|uniref:FAD-binding FR-type domain-containing protein n=1 Tax=Chlorella variabilis TaxID=554065 RepID=E1ZSU6_CHLVA|nr:hypothetical protein CHLNCDRAFT_141423 [Chlorella variabilis]EFN51098.1 hypothetical protein CHLNCDRAFT_141423 [Chlorella variabilis]|eukprot:XP_005843200.1 hypothetical protein CHLNCDRAFT_141423 [Chlorella variabilis]